MVTEINQAKKIENKQWVVAVKVGNVEGSIVRPISHLTKMRLPKRSAASTENDARAFNQCCIMEPILPGGAHDGNISPSPFVLGKIVATSKGNKFS